MARAMLAGSITIFISSSIADFNSDPEIPSVNSVSIDPHIYFLNIGSLIKISTFTVQKSD